ncbi:hypothetical protein [Bradyrhizobium sp. Ai1a-2]|uniref:hypothetical protein n=1 Tax=Bradyrhizobium sp. Ai1a-2 TaxID=196490 RepID=UPI0003FDA901|nr:hypothetical protein [Bradyrhizobium sp. Ai1a-2]
MPDRGYIKLYRSIWDHPAFPNEPYTRREAWTWLISKAAWRATRVRAGEHIVDLDRGEVPGAVRYLAAKWQWSKGKVERFLESLKNEHMIETRSGTGITVITICNYNSYQGGDDDDGTPAFPEAGRDRDATGTGSGQRRDAGEDNRKEIKHSRKEEGEEGNSALGRTAELQSEQPSLLQDDGIPPNAVPAKRKRRRRMTEPLTPLDPTWRLSEKDRQYARDRGWSDREIDFQFEKFQNHHIGKGNLWAKWSRAWMTWVGNGYDFRGSRPHGGPGTPIPNRADTAIEGMMRGLTEEDYFARDR